MPFHRKAHRARQGSSSVIPGTAYLSDFGSIRFEEAPDDDASEEEVCGGEVVGHVGFGDEVKQGLKSVHLIRIIAETRLISVLHRYATTDQ